MRYLLVGCLCTCCIGPASAATGKARLLAPFMGSWSNSSHGCELLATGKLESLSTAQASAFEIIRVSEKGITWPYSSGTAMCSFSAGAAKPADDGVVVPATCNYKGQKMKESISFTKMKADLWLRFVHGFARVQKLVKCR